MTSPYALTEDKHRKTWNLLLEVSIKVMLYGAIGRADFKQISYAHGVVCRQTYVEE